MLTAIAAVCCYELGSPHAETDTAEKPVKGELVILYLSTCYLCSIIYICCRSALRVTLRQSDSLRAKCMTAYSMSSKYTSGSSYLSGARHPDACAYVLSKDQKTIITAIHRQQLWPLWRYSTPIPTRGTRVMENTTADTTIIYMEQVPQASSTVADTRLYSWKRLFCGGFLPPGRRGDS